MFARTVPVVVPVVVLVVLLVVVAAGCTGDATSVGSTTVPHTGPTDDLAPSQRTAATDAPPDTPPPCDPDALTIWTARASVDGGWADAVLRVRNDGDTWCEVDVTGSPSVDPTMEPDVWLEPEMWADLVVGSPETECVTPAIVNRVQVDLNGAEVAVETAAVVKCEWWLTAFYPNDVADEPCAELDAVAVAGAVVVRNRGVLPCRLGSLMSVTGDGVAAAPGGPAVQVPMLAGGDVVAIELTADGVCDVRPVDLAFDTGVTLSVLLDGCAVSVASGAPQPWIGGPGSPAADHPADLLVALDPFGDGA